MKQNTSKGAPAARRKKNRGTYYFLGIVCLSYLFGCLFNPSAILRALTTSGMLCLRLLPAFCAVLLFMGIVNYLTTPRVISKYLGKRSGIKGWFLAAATGILSHGPIYIWFPFLKELKAQGMTGSLAAVFLYSRAVKIPLLPVMAHYFGLLFTIVLQCWLIAAALLSGLLIGLLVDRAKSPM